MSTQSIEYILEHKLLPQWFFGGGAGFARLVLADKEFIYRAFADLAASDDIHNPYSSDDFEVECITIDSQTAEHTRALIIHFPGPSCETLCKSAYYIYDQDSKKLSAYCIEKAPGNPEYHLCGWTRDGVHINYGACVKDDIINLRTAVSFYLSEHYGKPLPAAQYN